jgi:glycosyltransferase involved in cell wall biosynthesis
MFKKRLKITLAIPFPVFPVITIQAQRIFHFYRHLTQKFDIEIISLANAYESNFQGIIAPGLTEIRIPKTIKHQEAEIAFNQKLGSQVGDATLLKYYSLTPQYLRALKKSAKNADFLVTYQPYLFPALREISNKPIWYEASGVEAQLKKQILPNNELGQEFWELIYQTEQKCCQFSNLIITSSSYDTEQLNQIYGIDKSKIIAIPDGIDSTKIDYISYEERLINKEKLGLKENFIAIFSGTGNPHNANESRSILNIASKLPEMRFLLLGDLAVYFEPRLTPPNVGIMGNLDAKTKSIILGLADVALNPIQASSNNFPIVLEYFCRGIPVISTYLGTKNLGLQHEKHCLIGELWRFSEMLLFTSQEDFDSKNIRINNAQKYIKNHFDWSKIADNFFHQFKPWSLFY